MQSKPQVVAGQEGHDAIVHGGKHQFPVVMIADVALGSVRSVSLFEQIGISGVAFGRNIPLNPQVVQATPSRHEEQIDHVNEVVEIERRMFSLFC